MGAYFWIWKRFTGLFTGAAAPPKKRREVIALPDTTLYFDTAEKSVQWKMTEALYQLVHDVGKPYAGIAVLCIGTDRSTGDSYGPLTGHMLSRLSTFDFALYGTFREPVHALTLSQTLLKIDLAHTLVIAVDASVGNPEYVGYIGMSREPLRPGSGLGKKLPPVGDVSITGIAASAGLAPFLMLQNASLGMIYNMAEKTFLTIQTVMYRLRLENKVGLGGQPAARNRVLEVNA